MPDQHRHDEETGQPTSFSFVFIPTHQVGCVTVLVPPDIDQSLSSGDVTVTEVRPDITAHYSVTLSCVTFREATSLYPVSRTDIRSKLGLRFVHR